MTRGAELERVRHEGKRVRTGSLEVRAAASPHPFSRVGFIVPRYRHSAVDRNRVKRRLREVVRLELLPGLAQGTAPVDLVVRALPAAYAREQAALAAELRQAVRRLVPGGA